MARRAVIYTIHLRWGQPVQVRRSEFDRFRSMQNIFEMRRPKELRLKLGLIAWMEGNELRFAEHTPSGDRSRSLTIDSMVLVERQCASHDPRYIRDDQLRQRAIEAQYS